MTEALEAVGEMTGVVYRLATLALTLFIAGMFVLWVVAYLRPI